MLALLLVFACFLIIVGVYFYYNPLRHGRWFMMRRFINWLPLGMTYGFLYMGRYNLTVSKSALGGMMSNEDLGFIFAAGTVTYGFSFLLNGPLVDKLGGKMGIIIAALGSCVANVVLGVLTYLALMHRLQMKLVTAFSLAYSVNMYFQSYGAISIIKVKAYWFHVRERGVFGAVFGTLISMGIYFAFDWGQGIVNMTKVERGDTPQWLHDLARKIFASDATPVDAVWAVFFIPAAILLFWMVLDCLLIKDTPEEASFPHFDTHDASSGEMHIELTALDLLKKVFTSPLMWLFAGISFTSGVLRNGVYQWYFIFAKQVDQGTAHFIVKNWGLLLCVFGIIGGFLGGMISDRFFQSRRAPPVVWLSGFMFLMTLAMSASLHSSPWTLGCAAVGISMAVIGVTSLMAGTAAADFGGRKATATCSGIIDGFAYLGTGVQSYAIGKLVNNGNWHYWPIFLMPFALLGAFLALCIWRELPEATRRYIATVENRPQSSSPTVIQAPAETE